MQTMSLPYLYLEFRELAIVCSPLASGGYAVDILFIHHGHCSPTSPESTGKVGATAAGAEATAGGAEHGVRGGVVLWNGR